MTKQIWISIVISITVLLVVETVQFSASTRDILTSPPFLMQLDTASTFLTAHIKQKDRSFLRLHGAGPCPDSEEEAYHEDSKKENEHEEDHRRENESWNPREGPNSRLI